MTSPGDPATPFRVSYPGTVRKALADLYAQAQQLGIAEQFLTALRTLDVGLQRDPLHIGEPN